MSRSWEPLEQPGYPDTERAPVDRNRCIVDRQRKDRERRGRQASTVADLLYVLLQALDRQPFSWRRRARRRRRPTPPRHDHESAVRHATTPRVLEDDRDGSERTRLRDIAHIVGVTERTTPRGSSLDDLAQAGYLAEPREGRPGIGTRMHGELPLRRPRHQPPHGRRRKWSPGFSRAPPELSHPSWTPGSRNRHLCPRPGVDARRARDATIPRPKQTCRFLDGWMPTAAHSSSSSRAAPQLEDRRYPSALLRRRLRSSRPRRLVLTRYVSHTHRTRARPPPVPFRGRTGIRRNRPIRAERLARTGRPLPTRPTIETVRRSSYVRARPAGLTAALYCASEETQHNTSSKQYLARRPGPAQALASKDCPGTGPRGACGAELAASIHAQASRLRAEILIGAELSRHAAPTDREARTRWNSACRSVIEVRTGVVAAGVDYRRLEAPGVQEFVGAGIRCGSAPWRSRSAARAATS